MLRALGLLVLLAATAAAEPALELSIPGTAHIEVHVRGAAKPSKVELREVYGGSDKVAAQSVRGFLDGGPVAIAFVLSHNGEWTGQDVDVLTPLAQAFTRISVGSLLPAGSQAELITYATGAQIEAPWAPATTFDGTRVGTGRDYRGETGSDLVLGVDLAFAELAKRTEPRKLLIVIGDGSDTNNDEAGMNLRTLVEAHRDVTVAALVIKSSQSPEGEVIDQLTPNISRATDVAGIEAALKQALQLASDQFDATFDLKKFPHDGREHVFMLVGDNIDIASATLEMPPAPPAPSPAWQIWRWLVLGGVVVAFALMSKLMFRSR